MKLLSKLFLAVLLLTVTAVTWAACPEGQKQTYKGCEAVVSEDSSKKEQNPTLDESALLEDCDDPICGKWRTNNSGRIIIGLIYRSADDIWEFEKRLIDPGINRFGYKKGMVTWRFNKISEDEYLGEKMWRSTFGGLLGWYRFSLKLLSENLYVSDPIDTPNVNIVGSLRLTGQRIGEFPKQATEQITGSGTGFFVSNDGLIITNHHVIKGANEISVTVATGETFTAKVVSASATTDLALLRIPHQNKNYLAFEKPGSSEIGDDVFTLGFPISDLLGKEVKYTDGSISSLSGIQGDATFFQISVPIQPGNSGGPLVNEKGNVVGIVTSTAAVEAFYQATGSLPQNVNWAVKGAYASLLLPPGIQQDERSIANPITNAKWSVVFIETK